MNNKFLKNGFYNAAGGIIRIGLAILTIPLLIRLIGVEEYGLWTLASSVIAIIALAEAGLATATTVFVSQDLGKEDVDGLSQTLTVTVGAMLILATLAAIALWFGAETLVNFFPKLSTEQSLTAVQALQIAGVAVWARLLQQIVVGVEQAYQRYGVMNFLITLQSVLNNLGLLVIALLGGRTVALMHYQVYLSVVSLASHICLVWSLVNKTKININLNTTRVLIILKYSLFTWLSSLGSVLFTQCDRLILGTILGTYSLGTYAAITTITSQINVLSSLSVQPLLPVMSNLIANPNENSILLKMQIRRAFKINILIAFGMGIGLFLIAPFVMRLMIPSGVREQDILAFRLATIIYTIYSTNAVGYYILFAVNAVKVSLIINIISGILSLCLIYVLCSQSGLIGAVLGNSGYLLSLLFIPFALKRIHLLTTQNINNAIFY